MDFFNDIKILLIFTNIFITEFDILHLVYIDLHVFMQKSIRWLKSKLDFFEFLICKIGEFFKIDEQSLYVDRCIPDKLGWVKSVD